MTAQRERATRAAGLARLEAFRPAMGERYARGRNTDRGPGAHRDVSTLSPYLRRRLVTEPEVVAAALATHGVGGAEKFIQEVVWRGYFKGWLERRPTVWVWYRDGLQRDVERLASEPGLAAAVADAESGRTGLACFDAWAQELIDTGYLHNHARMWFASIWIFTFGLPWRIGADFFYRHLLDGDPASNTLGWRWVAGLHTRGKPYQARADNIAQFTAGRFAPRADDLAAEVHSLDTTQEPDGLPAVEPLRTIAEPRADVPAVLLITEEEGRIEEFDLDGLDLRAAATLAASRLRSPRAVSAEVAAFEAEALADIAARTGVAAEPLAAREPGDLARWAEAHGARQVVTGYVPQGPLRDWLDAAGPALAARGITLAEYRRTWDSAIWPHATAGFFRVKKQIPQILETTGLR